MSNKHMIAKRAGLALEDGDIVNLGIGIPTLVADYVPEGIKVYLHSENGILGVGPTPQPDEVDKNLVNAGKLPVTVEQGASFFDSASSFAMIRGGHIDVSILGVLQVDENGRVANWAVPGKSVLGVGGAMDLLEGSRKVIVTTLHTTKEGESKIVKDLQYPVTSLRKVDLIITELGVFEVDEEGLVLIELSTGQTIESVKSKTDARFRVGLSCEEILENNRRVKQ
ncbi:3-oxoacid CoA-transferase [Bacillus sp. SORGH_AS 510]|uniref:3-oxoacid CoA-transferase subunit B n=1 Tax=Bacillus sp. SORGH_AS_0510 TaxID=3041771 RepID=UPI00277E4A98|nr:3-oxoacid CoA-transferase subunit B [Bacillus sp. SORGH_AS_0510]MDQ1145692.1 3-oxoacid CoA-transferase [Bacillus sp. SORGH_AS_0510]